MPIAEKAFTTIFRGFELYGSPFRPSVSGRLLVYETDQWNRNPWGLSNADLGPSDAWPIVPHAIYPPGGAWGVITSDTSHALVGGEERFIADVAAGLGRSQEEMIAAWLEDWAGHQ